MYRKKSSKMAPIYIGGSWDPCDECVLVSTRADQDGARMCITRIYLCNGRRYVLLSRTWNPHYAFTRMFRYTSCDEESLSNLLP